MSQATDCCSGCETPAVVEVPGVQGNPGTPGTDGTDGVNAFTVTTANFTVPAIGNTVVVTVANSTWMTIGQVVFVQGAGSFSVSAKGSALSATLQYLDYATNTAAGNNVASGAQISPGGSQIVVATPGTLTDNTTGTAGSTLAAGTGVSTIAFYVDLTLLTNADILTTLIIGYAFKILAVDFGVHVAVGTGGKAATITPYIDGVAVTGGILSLTSANCTPKGKVVTGSAVTGTNTGNASATLSLTASAVTTFLEGNGWIILTVQNVDSANSIASLRSKVNTLITSLTT